MDKSYVLKKILDGLQTDGAHHKQFALEMILFDLVGDAEFEKLKKEYQWQDGIPS